MKKILALIFLFTVVLSCNNDENPQPQASAKVSISDAVGDKEVTFDSFSATDVGGQLDLSFKSGSLEIDIRLAAIDSGSYTLSRTIGNLKTFTGMAFITATDGKFMISKTGTVKVKVKDKLVSGSFTMVARNFPDKEESELTGTFEAISLGDISGLSCMLDRVTQNTSVSDFRYNKDGGLTSINRVTAKTQLNFAWFKGKPVAMFDDDDYVVFNYTSDRVSELKGYTLTINTPKLTDHEKFTYNTSGQLASLIFVVSDGELGICFTYEGGNVIKDFFCDFEDEGYNISSNYDTKNNPWQLVIGSLANETAIVTYLRYYFELEFSKNNIGKYNDIVYTHSDFNAKDYPQKTTYPEDGGIYSTTFRYKNCN